MYFQSLYINAKVPACTINFSLPFFDLPVNADQWFSLSVLSLMYLIFKSSLKLDIKSTWDTNAGDTCADFIFWGQCTIKGTLVPASYMLYLPPRSIPSGVWPLS